MGATAAAIRIGSPAGLAERLSALDPKPSERERALDVAHRFEEIFIRSMVQSLRQTSELGGDEDGLFGTGPGSDTYADWFDQHLSEHIGRSGQVGIADVLMREFERTHQIPKAPPGEEDWEAARAKEAIDVTA
ncbi:MAG: hypothetical protein Fur0037_05640 [Planctomycetota bacterium]